MKKIRNFLWRILGFDYQMMLDKTNYVLLKNDQYAKIGNKTYDNGAKVWRWTKATLVIGKYCSIAHNVNFIVDEGHHQLSTITNFPLITNLFKDDKIIEGKSKEDYLKRYPQKEDIRIGNDVWIGMGAYILPGVKVGNGVTIAANSVVTQDVEDYSVVAGTPAKVIKKKMNNTQIEEMNKIAWWNWEEKIIKERIDDFHKSIDSFIKKYKRA